MNEVKWIVRETSDGATQKMSVPFAERLLLRLESGDAIKNLGWSAEQLRAAIATAKAEVKL
jgi:hypothetical protein